jgi:hypothetical protein
MKKITFFGMLLFIVAMIFSCNKDEELRETPPSQKGDESTLLGAKANTIEALSEQYFNLHKDEATHAEKVISVTNEFLAINQQAEEFKNKKPSRIQPIYAYGIDGVAYYEVWFTEDNKTPKGWILISATDKDYPLVNFSHGIPYSSRLLNKSNQQNKIYRFGVSYYAMEENGRKIADYGKMPSYIGNSDVKLEGNGSEDSKDPAKGARKSAVEARAGVDYLLINDYESLKQLYAKHYYSSQRGIVAQDMKRRLFPANGHGEAVRTNGANLRTAGYYQYRWVPGAKTYYTQIPAYTSSNGFPCWSGCNNNAWAGIYGWWDANRGKSTLIPTTSTGETSPLYRNTTARQNAIDPVQMYSRSVSGTYCGDGTGWTYWYNGYKGVFYAGAKGYGYNYQYQWCNSTGCNVALANIVTEGIANNYNPVHIGANSHFYIGLGWAQWTDNTDWTWAYCYPGWSENDNDNVWIWWRDMNTATRLYIY